MDSNSILTALYIYIISIFLTFGVFFILKYILSKIIGDVYIKYIVIDSLILSLYSLFVVIFLDRLVMFYPGNDNMYRILEVISRVWVFLLIVPYFFIKRLFLKNHPKLTWIHWFIWELVFTSIWILSWNVLYVMTAMFIIQP